MYHLDDYDFEFRDERIALRPISPRGDAKLLYYDGNIEDAHVRDYPKYLDKRDMLIFNDTKVLAARIDGVRRRESAQGSVEAKISVTLLDPHTQAGHWKAMIRPLKKVDIGEEIAFSTDFVATLVAKEDGLAVLRFGEDLGEKLSIYGRMPLPPYIESKRPADLQDHADYQPLLAKYEGAVAAPTASLHFDQALMDDLLAAEITHETITLHVGAGTFLPVKVDDLDNHKMHAERGEIAAETAERINAHKAQGGRVIAVGTTALRLLETASRNGKVEAYSGSTDIFIRPGFEFQLVDGLITNFHLPKSTLLMLVAGFIGFEEMHRLYAHALAQGYRFFSYGDSSFLRRR